MVYLAGRWQLSDGAVGVSALATAAGKTGALVRAGVLPRDPLRTRSSAWRSGSLPAAAPSTDKVFAIVFPISAFVAAGFEHSVANMYFLSIGVLLKDHAEARGELSGAQLASLDASGVLKNLVASTLGNIVGGALLVGLVYWFVYLRDAERPARPPA